MRLLIFGTGKYYLNRETEFYKLLSWNDWVIGFVDNRANEIKQFHNLPVYEPKEITALPFEIIVLMSKSYEDMRNQLLGIGIPNIQIWSWEEYLQKQKNSGRIQLYTKGISIGEKRVLILTTDMNYNGGTIAAVYMALALQKAGYTVCMIAPSCEYIFLQEVMADGINVIIYPMIINMSNEIQWFISLFDIVIVNVFQMLPCACEVSKFCPTLWWIHEPKYFYPETLELFPKYATGESFNRIHILAVSDRAKKNFNEYFPQGINAVMPYGILDHYEYNNGIDSAEITFAIIGGISPDKGQHIFLSAGYKLMQNGFENIELLIIGSIADCEYAENIRIFSDKIGKVKFLGNLTRRELHDIYQRIDVVVCASREETMSLTVTEGLMYGKICITTESTGIAEYIQDGVNGFVCKPMDVEDLYTKMQWILNHQKECKEIRKKARMTYEKFFTMECFSERLMLQMKKAERNWHKPKQVE